MKWKLGRQGSGYLLLTLINNKICPFDLHIVKYPEGSSIPLHKDPVENGRHFRLNIILSSTKGGEFLCSQCIISTKYVKLFRPDINEHSVTKIEKGTRYVLSIGWALK